MNLVSRNFSLNNVCAHSRQTLACVQWGGSDLVLRVAPGHQLVHSRASSKHLAMANALGWKLSSAAEAFKWVG